MNRHVLHRRCVQCGVKNALKLTGEATEPGTSMVFTCGKCGARGVAVTPGNAERDSVMDKYDEVFERLWGLTEGSEG